METSDIQRSHPLLEKELTEGLSTYRTQLTLATQIVAVLLVGNLSAIGLAVSSGNFNFIYYSAIIPLIILFVRYVSLMLMIPITYCVYKFEKDQQAEEIDFLAMTYLKATDKSHSVVFDRIISIPSSKQRMIELNNFSRSWKNLFIGGNRPVSLLCLAGIVGQLVAPCLFQ